MTRGGCINSELEIFIAFEIRKPCHDFLAGLSYGNLTGLSYWQFGRAFVLKLWQAIRNEIWQGFRNHVWYCIHNRLKDWIILKTQGIRCEYSVYKYQLNPLVRFIRNSCRVLIQIIRIFLWINCLHTFIDVTSILIPVKRITSQKQ